MLYLAKFVKLRVVLSLLIYICSPSSTKPKSTLLCFTTFISDVCSREPRGKHEREEIPFEVDVLYLIKSFLCSKAVSIREILEASGAVALSFEKRKKMKNRQSSGRGERKIYRNLKIMFHHIHRSSDIATHTHDI